MTTRFWQKCKQYGPNAAVRRHLTTQARELTMPYPDIVNLPFNRSSLPTGFMLHASPLPQDALAAHWVLLQGGNLLLNEKDQGLQLPEGELPPGLALTDQPLAFAVWHGRQVRAVTVPVTTPLPAGMVAEPFNAFRERIPPGLLSIAATGKQLLHWQRMSRFCSCCGGQTSQLPESWGKQCPGCRTEHFPHIHPCAIVLIRRGDQLLLVRKPEWAPGRYGLVAGFLDLGESLEECAIREAKEETGVEIENLRYVTSQCWPFPSQMMAGFVADYAGGTIRLDDKELEDARWFTIGSLAGAARPTQHCTLFD